MNKKIVEMIIKESQDLEWFYTEDQGVFNEYEIEFENHPLVTPRFVSALHMFEMGDRVINVNSNHFPHIKYGSIGTVTGMSNFTVEVTFDKQD